MEFGLKLEDNRVAEWADIYMDYKKCICSIAEAVKKWEVLERCHPMEAEKIKRRKSFMMAAAAAVAMDTDNASAYRRRTSHGSLSNVPEIKTTTPTPHQHQ